MPAINHKSTEAEKSDIIHLPRAITVGTLICDGEVIIYDYTAPADGFKGKSVLHKNCISMVLQGKKTMRFADKTVKATAEDIHMLPTGNCVASMDISPLQDFRSILMFFDDVLLHDFFEKNSKILNELPDASFSEAASFISFGKDPFIRHFINSLQVMLSNKETLSSRMGFVKFEELMQYLLENYPLQMCSFRRPKLPETAESYNRKIVEANLTTDLTLEELAFLCNLSLSTFKRRFLNIFQTSPGNYLLQRRMQMAATLLKDSKQKPGQMYLELGYEDHSSFSRSFRKYYGVSPTEYQRRLLNGYAQLLDDKAKV